VRKIVGFVAWILVVPAIVVIAWGYAKDWVERMITMSDD
jgi:hypothetical protein